MSVTTVPIELSSTPGIVDNSNATAITIDSSENVGIGTGSPEYVLDVDDSSGNAYIAINRATQSQGEVGYKLDGGTSGGDWFIYQKTNGDDLHFYRDSDRVTMNTSGNVGIGTTSISARLHIVGGPQATTGALAFLRNSDATTSNTTFGGIHFSSSPGTDFSIGKANVNATTTLSFRNGNTGAALMDLDSSGNLGIGQSSPATKLDVNGGLHSDHATFTSVAGRGLKISTESRSGQNDGIGVLDAQDTEGTKGIISLQSGGTETARVTTSQILIGQTSGSASDVGVIFQKTGNIFATADDGASLYLRRLTSNGEVMRFTAGSTTAGSINANSGSGGFIEISGGGGSNTLLFPLNSNPPRIQPSADDSFDIGTASARFDDIFATNGTINTSDRNEKQDIEELADAEKRVAVAAKGLLRKYRWKSSVEEKGEDARIHFGIIAQDLQDAFTAEGLDASRYGMFCSNTWTNDDGTEQTRLGVRYSQVLAFIIAAI